MNMSNERIAELIEKYRTFNEADKLFHPYGDVGELRECISEITNLTDENARLKAAVDGARPEMANALRFWRYGLSYPESVKQLSSDSSVDDTKIRERVAFYENWLAANPEPKQ